MNSVGIEKIVNAALLVVDVQNGLFDTEPPPQDAHGVIARINQIIAAARKRQLPIIFIQHDGKPEEKVLPFTEEWNLHRALHISPSDLVLRKTTCDAFFETHLEREVRSRGIETLILCGFATEFCIDSTL